MVLQARRSRSEPGEKLRDCPDRCADSSAFDNQLGPVAVSGAARVPLLQVSLPVKREGEQL